MVDKMFIKPKTLIILMNVSLAFSELTEIVDLTWDFSNETHYWIGITPFSYTKIVEGESDRGYWYSMREFCAGEHGGTHFDAPYHFYKEGWKVAEVPVTRLIAKGVVIDLSDTDTIELLPKHLESWVHTHGSLENNTVLLIKFGRSKFWGNRTEYMALDAKEQPHFPGISADAATWIANSDKIVGVGLDTPSVDRGDSLDMMTHRIFSKNQIYSIENVKLLRDLPPKGFTIVTLPMKLKEGTGAPARVVAVPKGFF